LRAKNSDDELSLYRRQTKDLAQKNQTLSAGKPEIWRKKSNQLLTANRPADKNF